LNGVTWNICRGYILQFKINVKSVSAKRKSTSVVLISLELATGVIAISPFGPETVHSVKEFNLVLQINKQTDDSTFLDIQTRLSDKKKREISDCLRWSFVKLVKNTIF
jgi:hypothetical protein